MIIISKSPKRLSTLLYHGDVIYIQNSQYQKKTLKYVDQHYASIK